MCKIPIRENLVSAQIPVHLLQISTQFPLFSLKIFYLFLIFFIEIYFCIKNPTVICGVIVLYSSLYRLFIKTLLRWETRWRPPIHDYKRLFVPTRAFSSRVKRLFAPVSAYQFENFGVSFGVRFFFRFLFNPPQKTQNSNKHILNIIIHPSLIRYVHSFPICFICKHKFYSLYYCVHIVFSHSGII